MLWEIDIYPAPGCRDRLAEAAAEEAAELHLADALQVRAAHGYLISGRLDRREAERLADELLADATVERTVVDEVGSPTLARPPEGGGSFARIAGAAFPVPVRKRWEGMAIENLS